MRRVRVWLPTPDRDGSAVHWRCSDVRLSGTREHMAGKV